MVFIRKTNTTTLISFLEVSLNQQEIGNMYYNTILLDYSKAFHCQDYKYLLNKLSIEIQGPAKVCFSCYLNERSQMIEIRHTRLRKMTQFIELRPMMRGSGLQSDQC